MMRWTEGSLTGRITLYSFVSQKEVSLDVSPLIHIELLHIGMLTKIVHT